MALNIADAESSLAQGRIEFMEWKEQFEARWVAPLAQAQLAMMLRTIQPQERMMVDPQKLARVEALLKGR